jgi:uncharacterized protein YkwD
MRKRVLLISLATAILLLVPAVVFALKPHQTAVQAPQTVVANKLNADTLFTLVNAERAKNGLQPLIRDARLDETAQERADDMINRNYFSHYDPVTGGNLVQIIPTNPQCISASENIIKVDEYGEKNADALRWWLNSKSHREAILRADYTLTGVAVNGNIGVQHFCVSK